MTKRPDVTKHFTGQRKLWCMEIYLFRKERGSGSRRAINTRLSKERISGAKPALRSLSLGVPDLLATHTVSLPIAFRREPGLTPIDVHMVVPQTVV